MSLFSQIKGSIAFICYVVNTLFWALPILACGIIKLIPLKIIDKICSYLADACASAWIYGNVITEKCLHPVKFEVSGDTHFDRKQWYMVIANHQSWVDILVLQRTLNGKIPFLKFFLKQQLLYVPVLGLVWWALDFPFMRRFTTAQLKKNPSLRGKDIEITRKACEKFKTKPVSVMNFVEGTRFSTAKHNKQASPYQYLLKPKAGGMAFALSAMGEHINKLVNVTLYYPGKVPSFWEYLCGQTQVIKVDIRITDIPDTLRGDYINDRQFKIEFQEKLNQIWLAKDKNLQRFHQNSSIDTEINTSCDEHKIKSKQEV
ncbi:acyltransferase [Shewanella gaetbuli]|uniref:Acyltransferase n=1 Tax=Shewanella gaetbuli TaxID=220752 RepID=A0A9X1ZM06_9GAMM|nr:acyltransferase [Shewanella gaetbuli]MCL1142192.1 acyltransferase [Shewanella gaetbuli]